MRHVLEIYSIPNAEVTYCVTQDTDKISERRNVECPLYTSTESLSYIISFYFGYIINLCLTIVEIFSRVITQYSFFSLDV